MAKNEFEELKEKIITLIKDKKEITTKTDYRCGGIYMLFVDNFNDEKILPFYIGKTHNFQERHKEHMKEIFAINRLKKEYYVPAIFNNYFEGYYKSCKFFKYLVDKECELKNVRMVILEECEDEEERTEIEMNYINKYLAPFLGFNQLNSISLASNNGTLSNSYRKYIKTDIENIRKYAKYGFNRLNYILAKKIFENYEPKLLEELKKCEEFKKVELLLEQNKEKTQEREKMLRYARKDSKEECKKLCINFINAFFEENGLKSEDKKDLIVECLVYDSEKDKKAVTDYIQRFSKGSKEDIISLILETSNGNKIKEISNKMEEITAKLPINEEEICNIRIAIFDDIIPKKEYISFPLKDLYPLREALDIKQVGSDNVLYINIEYSNHGRKIEAEDYPEPLKVDYAFYKGFDKVKETYYINSVFDNFFEKHYYYIKRGIYFFGKPDPFNILKTGDGYTISTSMEYYNGINEYTLQGKEKQRFVDVIKEIDSLIDEETKVIYTSGNKKAIKILEETDFASKSMLMKKLLATIKY